MERVAIAQIWALKGSKYLQGKSSENVITVQLEMMTTILDPGQNSNQILS